MAAKMKYDVKTLREAIRQLEEKQRDLLKSAGVQWAVQLNDESYAHWWGISASISELHKMLRNK